MIEDEVACEAMALLGTAATMVIEDAHAQAAAMQALGSDLSVLAGAAAVLARRARNLPSSGSTAA